MKQGTAGLSDSDATTSGAWGARLKRIDIGEFSVQPEVAGVTAFVGGNNVGKSTLLREIDTRLKSDGPGDFKVTSAIAVEGTGSADQFSAWLKDNAYLVSDQPAQGPSYARMGTMPTELRHLLTRWGTLPDRTFGSLGQYFVNYSRPLDRMHFSQGAPVRSDLAEMPSHPLHDLEFRPDRFRYLEELCDRLFRKQLTFDRLSGHLVLRVGRTSLQTPLYDEVNEDYRRALSRLPRVSDQGDGMQSLLGLLLPLVTANYPVVLIDEPEAFLHPPQAFELGRILSEIAAVRQVQIIVATHDRNLITGLLDSDTPVSVVRLERDGDVPSAHQLRSDAVRELMDDPVLKYSNILDGLFHRVVVVAEADRDCRFYAAALDHANELVPLDVPPSEVLFVPSYGKQGMIKIVKALKAVSVRVTVSPDLDVLNDSGVLKSFVQTLDGDWSLLEQDYRLATQRFSNKPVALAARDVLAQALAHLGDDANKAWSKELKEKVQPILRTSDNTWENLKLFGMAAFTDGDSRNRAESLLAALTDIGICCVRAGDLERLAPKVRSRKGAGWIVEALGTAAHKGELAQEHIRLIASASGITSPRP